MNKKYFASLTITIFASGAVFAQSSQPSPTPKRSRVIVTENIPVATPTPRKVIIVPSASRTGSTPAKTPAPTTSRRINRIPLNSSSISAAKPNAARSLRYIDLQGRINEAKRQMQVKPLRISMNDTTQAHSIVRLAFFDWSRKKVDYAVISKPTFLDKTHDAIVRSEGGKTVRVRTIRGNGVNTPVMVFDLNNQSHLPLLVQYPIEKYGRFREMSYYISTHPGLGTPEVVAAGRTYVRNVLDVARQKLRSKGIFVQPKVVDIAERLALVEHVDHSRFRNEYHPRIYNDVYTLYAMNKGQTYRFSVSRAGAGGMVQMIPSTYRMIRSRYYRVGLIPDFVTGMRNHANAAQAMLLYMQMTWNDLVSNSTVRGAMERGIATQEQLMAAGYNSNPARLPKYIRRGGARWTSLIPRETKVYLRIYQSVERYVPMRPRTR